MRAQVAMAFGLALVVAAVWVAAGEVWGAVVMGLVGLGVFLTAAIVAVGDGRS